MGYGARTGTGGPPGHLLFGPISVLPREADLAVSVFAVYMPERLDN